MNKRGSTPEFAELLPVDCECAAGCGEQVLVTATEFAAAHQETDYVLIRPGHPVDPGSRGARVVIANDRYAVVAEGWALTDDEISAESRARLAELKSQSLFAVICRCADCDTGPLADAAEVQVTLDEWERLRDVRLVNAGHSTAGATELERNERFVAIGD
jgi:hypothetical protein